MTHAFFPLNWRLKSVVKALNEVRARGGRLYLKDDELRMRGSLSPPLTLDERDFINGLAADIIDYLRLPVACARCESPMPSNRSYVCEACSAAALAAVEAAERTDSLPTVESWGLRIPWNADPRYQWWAGGQPVYQTALELGLSGAELDRYAGLPSASPLRKQKETASV